MSAKLIFLIFLWECGQMSLEKRHLEDRQLMHNSLEKIKGIQQKIEDLKAEQLKIEQVVSLEILNALKKQDAFGLDFDALIGGLLDVIEQVKLNNSNTEGWRQAGQKFRGGSKPKAGKAIKAKKEMA